MTNQSIIQKLGTSFPQTKLLGDYQFTHELADWAKANGYSGIKSYGAHDIVGGITVEPYVNLIIFEQATIDAALTASTPIFTPW